MGILIGMDEAGYGPQLGPLVVAATAWHVTEEGFGVQGSNGEPAGANGTSAGGKRRLKNRAHSSAGTTTAVLNPQSAARLSSPKSIRNPKSDPTDLYRLLRHIVAKRASERRIAIADSKVLYTPGLGLRHLERGLHSVLRSMRQTLACWTEMVQYCGADPDGHHARACWPEGHNCALPVDASCDELARLEARFARACEAAGVRPLLIRARLVFPEEFNNLTAYYNSKGAALSHVTVALLREVVDAICPSAEADSPTQPLAPSPQHPIYAVCDKHGGRNYYTALLQHHFSEHWIAPVFETHSESLYEWGEPDARMRVVFRVNGERFLPTALASMTAKYLRELAMRAFNEFWRAHLPDLKPTAGYYRDARRFKNDIAAKQRELAIDDHVLWRNR